MGKGAGHTRKSCFQRKWQVWDTVKFGAPHFVDFGKNMEYSPDGKAYLVGHGAESDDPYPRFGNLSWISGDQIYMCRVTPSPENMNDLSTYEFFSGHDADGKAIWTSDINKCKPLIDWNNNAGCVTMSYFAPLKKYIMCVTDGWPTSYKMSSYFLESDHITGPFKLIAYLKDFGEQAYFLNFPTKFISEDGYSATLFYSGNYARSWNGKAVKQDPPGSAYGLMVLETIFLTSKTYKQYKDNPRPAPIEFPAGN